MENLTTQRRSQPAREALAQTTERLASVLVESGWPRMPARVFVVLLSSDSGACTSAELSERLGISPAAVSGAVRYLAHLGLVTREREPGSRRDSYRVRSNVWNEVVERAVRSISRWQSALQECLDSLGEETPAARRLGDAMAFFEFYESEMSGLLKRWQEHHRPT